VNGIDREVIRDLLPLVVAGEASPASRALVERAIQGDAEIAREAERMRRLGGLLAASETDPASQDAERRVLSRTKRLLRARQWLLAAAGFTLLLPLSIYGSSDGIEWMMWRDAPGLAWASVALSAALWAGFGWCARRLSVAGF